MLSLAVAMKADRFGYQPLAGPRAVAVLLDKPTLRTRVSFAVGIAELGGQPMVIDAQASQMGRGEPIADTAHVFDRQVAAIVWRTFGQDRVEEMARASAVPVINALTDAFHPCQVLADLQTVRAVHGGLAGRTLTFLGDGSSNMAHSYLLGGATAGLHVRIAAPAQFCHDPQVLADAGAIASATGGSVTVSADPKAACADADVLATDVWTSMGFERENDARRKAFADWIVDAEMMAVAKPDALFMHCLPAHRGEEVDAAVIDGPQSVVWDEAENRMHTAKALMALTMGGYGATS